MSSFRQPSDFLLDLAVVGLWLAVARCMRRETTVPAPVFVFGCAALVLLLGRLATGHFIYAGF
jgi:hypothetical protein